MRAKTIMIQGTASNVGKSLIATAVCRILSNYGYKVAPFKAQNMSHNSYVTADGCEVSRAQAAQAEAARTPVSAAMNPLLIKPVTDQDAQIIVNGRPVGNYSAEKYYARKDYFLEVVKSALRKLTAAYEIVVIEGAGSPAEINLSDRDIVNMRVAQLAGAPVILVADIDVGGMFAAVVGTMELLSKEDRQRVKGVIVNKFRGCRALLEPGLKMLEERVSRPVLGVIPYCKDLSIDAEDSVDLFSEVNHDLSFKVKGKANVVIVKLPHIANFTDFNALRYEKGLQVVYAPSPPSLSEVDAVIVPGTKAVVSDLNFMEERCWREFISGAAAAGKPVIGICGGFQILGRSIDDPDGVEGGQKSAAGLNLLPIRTTLLKKKTLCRRRVSLSARGPLLTPLDGLKVEGYEIHVGGSDRLNGYNQLFKDDGDNIGAVSDNGLVIGTYLHGIFDNDKFRDNFVAYLRRGVGGGRRESGYNYAERREGAYEKLAALVEQNLEMSMIRRLLFNQYKAKV